MTIASDSPLIGVLALQGAFEEHQHCLEAIGCRTVQVRCVFVCVFCVCLWVKFVSIVWLLDEMHVNILQYLIWFQHERKKTTCVFSLCSPLCFAFLIQTLSLIITGSHTPTAGQFGWNCIARRGINCNGSHWDSNNVWHKQGRCDHVDCPTTVEQTHVGNLCWNDLVGR